MSGIHLRAPVFILFFLLKIQPLMASIDGGPEFQANWDGNQWQLPPGQHRLSVWFKYFWFLPVGRADLLASFALFDNDPNRINTLEAGFAAVTPALIQKTAQEYLRPTNRTILVVNPGKKETSAR